MKTHPRTAYTVFWLGRGGKVIRSHYFESTDYPTAFDRTLRKRHKLDNYPEIMGFYLCEAPLKAAQAFRIDLWRDKPRDFTQIESHLYAPLHLRDDYLAKLKREGAA